MNHPLPSPAAPTSLPALLALLVFALPCSAQEWPRFRGLDGAGIAPDISLPEVLSESDYEWSVELDGAGHSSPVAWGGKLFLTVADDETKERRVECYALESGERLWAWTDNFEAHNLHRFNNFASSSPVAGPDGVYVAWGSSDRTEAVGLDHEGALLWRRDWPDFSSDHGFASSPILADGVLVINTDDAENRRSRVMGLDPASGETLWELVRESPDDDSKHATAYNTPVAVEAGGRTILVVLQTNDGWRGLDPRTGEVLWHHRGEHRQRSVGSIATGEGLVFATLGSGGQGRDSLALRITENGAPEVAYALGLGDGLPYVPTPLIRDGLLYLWGDGGVLTCRDAHTGEEIYRERVEGNFFSSPVAAGDAILCASRDGELVMVAAGREFRILGRSRLPSGVNATPAVAGGRLILRTDTHLISIAGS